MWAVVGIRRAIAAPGTPGVASPPEAGVSTVNPVGHELAPRATRPPAVGAETVGFAGRARQKRGSRPISRVLSRATIHLGRTSPYASSDLPGSPCGPQERAPWLARFPMWSCSRWGLPCRRVLPPARCALTAPFHPYLPAEADIGGLLSVALSVGSRPPGVTWHLALWSPDFPLQNSQRLPGRLPRQ